MKSRPRSALLIASAVLAVTRFPRLIHADAVDYHLERVGGILNQPTYLAQAPGDPSNTLFYSTRITSALSGFGAVNTMGGIFRMVTNGTTTTTTQILDMSSRNITNDDGLQTFAFNPDFYNATASGYGKIYVASAQQGSTSLNRVEQFTVLNANGTFKSATDSFATRVTVLQYSNSAQNNHTVDWVGFDPNATGAARNYLYITTGDGSYGDNYNNASGTNGRPSQNPSDNKGKILRVDIAGADAYPGDPNRNFAIPSDNPIPLYNAAHPLSPIMGVDSTNTPVAANGEVYVTGVRNGYRISFDRANSDIWVGDVGEVQMEEVDYIKAGSNSSGPPIDLGWPQREGLLGSAISGAPQSGTNPFTGGVTINPIQTFQHTAAGNASVGGYVYRGNVVSLQGKYFYSDFVTGRIWQLDFDPNTPTASFNGHNGTLTQVDPLWNALIKDPANAGYVSNVSLGAQNGLDHVVSFSEDNNGNLYMIDFGYGTTFDGQYTASAGEIFKIVPGALVFPTTAVWKGNLGASWNTSATASNNFTDSATGSALTQLTGYTTDVVFVSTSSGASNYSTVLNKDFFVNSLTVKNNAPLVTVANGTSGTATLVMLGGAGITLEAGSNGLLITSNLELGTLQTWTNNSASPLTITGGVSGPGGITLTGTLTMGSTGFAITGPLTFTPNAKLVFTASNATCTVGALNTDPTTVIENAASVSATALNVLETYSYDTVNFVGLLRDGPSGHMGFRVNGGGMVITSASTGAMTFTGSLNVRYGALVLNGTQHAIGGASTIVVGDSTNLPALLVVNGASLSASTGTASVQVGAGTAQGALILNSGSVTSSNELWVSTTNLGAGALIVNGGTLTTGSWLAIARGGGDGILTVTGGTVNVNASPISVGSSGAGSTTYRAVATFSGGVINANQNVFAGEINSGIITLMGSALLTITSAAGGSGLNNGINGLGLANNNNTLGVFNLNGGTLTTPHIMKRTGQTGNIGVFNFNGGTLRPNGTASLSTFIQNLDGAYIYGGGAFIDDTGATLTIPQPLLNPTGSGVSAITLSGGSGFLAPPVISIGGGGGFGATAVANIDAGGNLTSVTITNPGVGYTSAPTLTLFGGAGEPTSTSYTVTLATNSGGGLTKLGAGTVILTGNNTYMGPTSIQSGKLVLGNGGTTGSLGIGNIVNSGELGFNRTDALTVLGNISGIGGLSQAGTGTTTLAGIYGATGAIKVTAGTLAFAETTAARRTANVLITTNALSITNNGSVMDIGNRDVMITNQTPASSNTIINTYWKNGTALLLGAGDPSGPQITSSTVNNNTSSFPTFIVAFDIDAVFGGGVTGDGSGAGSSLGAYTDNQVVTQPGTIMVKYGYYTDIDFSGKVDAGDINLVLGALGSTSPGLSNPGLSYLLGDVDYSGKVDAGDINLVLGMLGAGSGGANGNPLGVSSVPEPASAALLACGGLLLLGRRRREVRRRAGEGIAER